MSSHANAFEEVALAYERGRPGYPEALVDWLAERRDLGAAHVVDLAAGTGKLTRALAPRVAALAAVEPLASMRALCAALVPGARVIAGRAEELPLRSGSVDLVTCGQSFHWFATPQVLGELARVLRPDGELLLVWNEHAPVEAVHRRLLELEAAARPDGVPDAELGGWRMAFEGQRAFSLVDEVTFRFDQLLDRAAFLDRAASMSVFARLDAAERAAHFAELAGLVDGDEVRLGYETAAFSFIRR